MAVDDPHAAPIEEAGLQTIGELIVATRAGRALSAAVELGVFDALGDGTGAAEGIAATIGADPRRTEILLDALSAIGLLRKHDDGTYANTATGREYLLSGSPQSLASNLRYQERLAGAWAALPEVIRTGQPHHGLIELLEQDRAFTEHYIRGMAEIARPAAQDLVRQLDLSGVRTALDVGGGPGVFAAALAQQQPAMEVHLLDLAPALRIAGDLLGRTPGGERVVLREGDYLQTDYGTEAYDLLLLSHVTHDESEAANLAMLKRAHQALRAGGQVVIHDFMVDASRTRPAFGALFSLHLSVYTQKGRTYSTDEYSGWLARSGFCERARLTICPGRPNATSALIGIKR